MFRLVVAAAVGYAAARTLLEREVPADLPEPVRTPLVAAQGRLRELRALAREALAAVDQERARAERELHEDFLRRTHRR